MTYTGRVEKGVVVFEGDLKPHDGVIVRVEEVASAPIVDVSEREGVSIWESLRDLDGKAVGLPSDMAINHDHYIHGADKRVVE